MLLIATGFLLFRRSGLHTGTGYILAALIPLTSGMALSMSPMTAAIMSAVPQRRAGAGSAMNDATRELGAALGVAVLGSIAASQYSSHLHDALGAIPASRRARPRHPRSPAHCTPPSSSPVRPRTSSTWPRRPRSSTASTSPRCSASVSASSPPILTTRYLPRVLVPEGALSSPVAAMENTAELGLGGVPPILADSRAGDLAHEGAERGVVLTNASADRPG